MLCKVYSVLFLEMAGSSASGFVKNWSKFCVESEDEHKHLTVLPAGHLCVVKQHLRAGCIISHSFAKAVRVWGGQQIPIKEQCSPYWNPAAPLFRRTSAAKLFPWTVLPKCLPAESYFHALEAGGHLGISIFNFSQHAHLMNRAVK